MQALQISDSFLITNFLICVISYSSYYITVNLSPYYIKETNNNSFAKLVPNNEILKQTTSKINSRCQLEIVTNKISGKNPDEHEKVNNHRKTVKNIIAAVTMGPR